MNLNQIRDGPSIPGPFEFSQFISGGYYPGVLIHFPRSCRKASSLFHRVSPKSVPDAPGNLDIKPAANGFISNLADALKVSEYIRNAGGEPSIWLPWLIFRYDR